jgi:hypothetical protein
VVCRICLFGPILPKYHEPHFRVGQGRSFCRFLGKLARGSNCAVTWPPTMLGPWSAASTCNASVPPGSATILCRAVTHRRLRDLVLLCSILLGIGRPPSRLDHTIGLAYCTLLACCETGLDRRRLDLASWWPFSLSWRVLSRCWRVDHVLRRTLARVLINSQIGGPLSGANGKAFARSEPFRMRTLEEPVTMRQCRPASHSSRSARRYR